MRVGQGYDVHRLVAGRPLILGGVEVEHERGLEGHSDADVLAHAVGDALLGALGAGDLGYKSISITPDARAKWLAPPLAAGQQMSDSSAQTMVEPEAVLVSSAQEAAIAPPTRKRVARAR